MSAATGAVADATPGAVHEVAGTAHEVSAGVAKGKELPEAAQVTAEQKVEVAVLGTKRGAAVGQAKGIGEEAARKLEGIKSAKDAVEKADQGVDSADIEE